jgi:branched-chain amino acid transport system ATP-binding protein
MTRLLLTAVSKSFGGIVALQDVSFTVAPGEILGLMGANGAGKTTLFSIIAGNTKLDGGSIELDGEPIDGLTPDKISRRGIARTFQIVRPFDAMTVLENVTTAALFGAGRSRRLEEASLKAQAILAEVGLAERAGILASTMTLAERKRLELARALATEPKILLLDEVLTGLTATEVSQALEMLKGVKKRRDLTVIMVEHVMRALMRLSDRVVVLHQGCKIAEGRPEAIAQDPAVIEAYFGAGYDGAA